MAPTDNAIQDVYSPLVAAAMRQECVLFYDHLLQENRSVLELLDSDYTFANRRLAKSRAESVVTFLDGEGVGTNRIRTEAAPTESRSGSAQSVRFELGQVPY